MTAEVAAEKRDLDEVFDAIVCRPLGRLVAKWAVQRNVTANQVSLLAAFCGLAAGSGFMLPWPYPFYGALLLFVMTVLDCADGEIARLKGGGGWKGRMLDGLADLVTAFAVHLGMLLYLNRVGASLYGYELSPLANFFIALGAGASMSWRCGVVDDIKQRLKAHSIDRELSEHAGEARTIWDRLLYRGLELYVANIKRYAGKKRPGGYTAFRRAQLVGPTHHHLAMVLTALAIPYLPQAYLAFFIISLVPANLYLLMVLWLAPNTGEESVNAADHMKRVG